MRDRVESLGGVLTVLSAPGHGTLVKGTVPLARSSSPSGRARTGVSPAVERPAGAAERPARPVVEEPADERPASA